MSNGYWLPYAKGKVAAERATRPSHRGLEFGTLRPMSEIGQSAAHGRAVRERDITLSHLRMMNAPVKRRARESRIF